MDVNEPARWEEALRLFQEADAIRATREASYEIGAPPSGWRAPISRSRATRRRSTRPAGRRAARRRPSSAPTPPRWPASDKGAADGRDRSGGIDRGRLPLRRPLVLFPGETVIEIIDSQGHRTPHRLKLTAGQLEILDISSSPSSSLVPRPRRRPSPPRLLPSSSRPPEPPPASPPLTPTPPAPHPPPPPEPSPPPIARPRLVVGRRRPRARGGQRRDGGGVIQPHRRRAR